jgi:uncharacterized membrane protein YciS (DUF1049 family)
VRIIFNIISIIILLSVLFLASLNTQTVFDFTVLNAIKNIHALTYQVNLVQIMLLTFIAGTLCGVLWVASFYIPLQKKLKEYQRKLEKTTVQSDEDSSKVNVLEEKIKVLETALQSALEKNNN